MSNTTGEEEEMKNYRDFINISDIVENLLELVKSGI